MRRGLSIVFGLLLLAACAARPQLDQDETELVTWWIEDVCRGVPRTIGELRTEDSSQGLQRVAAWLATRGAAEGLPPQLAARKARWAVVRHFLAEGTLLPAEDGLLAVDPAASGDTAELARSVVKDENRDRLTGEVLLLSQAREDEEATRRLRRALRSVRTALDREATGRR